MSNQHMAVKAFAFYLSPIKLSEQHQPVQAFSLNGNAIYPKVFVRMVRLPDHCIGNAEVAFSWAEHNVSLREGEILLNILDMEG